MENISYFNGVSIEEIDVETNGSYEYIYEDIDSGNCDQFACLSPPAAEEIIDDIEEIDVEKNNLFEIVYDDNVKDIYDQSDHSSPQPSEEAEDTVNSVESILSEQETTPVPDNVDDDGNQEQHRSTPKTSKSPKKRKRNRNDRSKITIKRKKNPELWKQNIRKALCQRGLPFIDQHGIARPGRTVGPACSESCFHNCTKEITPEKRQQIHDYFWSLSKEKRDFFYADFVKRVPVKRRQSGIRNRNNPVKKATFQYYLKIDERTVRVCKKYFLNTLSITDTVIFYFFSKHYNESKFGAGDDFTDIAALKRASKAMGPPCGNTCQLNCTRKITPKKRKEIHDYFCSLTKAERKEFYTNFVKKVRVKRRKILIKNKKKILEKVIIQYFLKPGNRTVEVCRKYFLNTLSITFKVISYYFKNHYEKQAIESQNALEKEDAKKFNSFEIVYDCNSKNVSDQFALSSPELCEETEITFDGDESIAESSMNTTRDSENFNNETSMITRKRTRNKEVLKQNVKRAPSQRRLPLIDQNGIKRSAKTIGSACTSFCKYNCAKKITPEKRQKIHNYFWSLSKEKRNLFLKNFIKNLPVKRRQLGTKNKKNPVKKASFQYYLKPDIRKIQVCQKYFLNTLSLAETDILNIFSKQYQNTVQEPDERKNDINDDIDEGSCDTFEHSSLQQLEETESSESAIESILPERNTTPIFHSFDVGGYQEQHANTSKTSKLVKNVRSTLTKNKKRNAEVSKLNIRSALSQKGLPLMEKNCATQSGKTMGPACADSCYHNCTKEITPAKRQKIHNYFWSLPKEKRNLFYANFVKKVRVKRRQSGIKRSKNPLKKATYQYYLKPDERTIRVCKKYFLNTLSITDTVILYFFSKHYENTIESENNAEGTDARNNDSNETVYGDIDEGSCDRFAHLDREPLEETESCSVSGDESILTDQNATPVFDSFDDGGYQDEDSSTLKTSTLKRKRRGNTVVSKLNIRSSLGKREQLMNPNGTKRSNKTEGPACGDSCHYNCAKKITPKKRKEIYDYFWSLSEEKRNVFYADFVKKLQNKDNLVMKPTFQYYLKTGERTIEVCKEFFLNTLSITDTVISNLFTEQYEKDTSESVLEPLNCGRRSHSDEQIEEVICHIKSFPVVDSHYCRNSSNRQCLDSSLSINKMYSLYLQNASSPISISSYRQIFNTKFNYCLNVSKKDLCGSCTLHETQNIMNQALMFKKHVAEKEYTEKEFDADLKNIQVNNAVLLYDLQNVFSLPKIWASSSFYKRKLCVYNLTGTLILPDKKVTYCAIWNESHSVRSENDIASALTRILDQVVKDFPEVRGLTLWSDLSVPQNKNQMTASALLQFLYDNPSIKYINQKFSEPCLSSLQEADCVHSTIEKYLRELEIPSQVTLVRLLKKAKFAKVQLRVLEMETHDFKYFGIKAEKLNFSSILFADCKSLIYQQNDLFAIGKKCSFKEKSYVFCPLKKKTTRFQKVDKIWEEPMQLAGKQQICRLKAADLQSMMPFLTDEADKDFYDAFFKQ